MKRALFSIFFLATVALLNAAKVDTLVVFSSSMKKNTKTCVVYPDTYSKTKRAYPVVYLLHGYSGNYASWANDFPQVKQFSDKYNMIIVGVDGNFSSWYFDSPVDTTMKYETYVTQEIVNFIDNTFNTLKKREGRAICGLSMGGHGALYLSMRHPDVYGVAGSMSGGVDFRPFPHSWDLPKRLGDITKHSENWEKNTVIYQLNKLQNGQLAIKFDCGVDDFFIGVNRQLHEKMLSLNIKHDYVEGPGGHTKEYWNNALQYHFIYFDNFFKQIR